MRRYRDPDGRFELPVPEGWRLRTHVPDTVLVLVDETPSLGFHPNVVVTLEELADSADVSTWVTEQGAVLSKVLVDPLLLDVERVEVAGIGAQRLLCHHDVDGHAVTLEQWVVPAGNFGWTLSASVASLAYDRYADLIGDVVEGFRLTGAT